MTELVSLYNSCFYKVFKSELCPYKNIKWQFADARKINKYDDKSYSIETITYTTDMINKFILENFNSDDKNEITDELLLNLRVDMFEYNINVIDILTDINIILTDTSLYIEKLLDRQIFKKQLNKMNEETKSIFSKHSFILLADAYKTYFKDVNIQGFVHMIELLISFFKLCPAGVCSEEHVDNANDIIQKLNGLSFPKDILIQYGYIAMAVGNCAMDIYFILRIYKQDNDIPNKKIVVSYFGSIHSDKLIYYFTEIVKTHTVQFFSRCRPDIRRIEITETINLNEIMEHEPIIIKGGKNKKTKKIRKSRKNRRKTNRVKHNYSMR